MTAHRTLAVALRVIRQFRHDRRSLGLLIIVPLVLLSLIGYLWQPSQTSKPEPVAIVNEDPSPLGRVIVDTLRRAPSLEARVLDATAAEDALRGGEVNALIRIPRDFSARAGSEPIEIRVEGSDPFVTGNTIGAVQKAIVDAAAGASGGGIRVRTSYLHGGTDYGTLDYLAPVLIPFLAFFLVFLLTDVAFLRERASGTLERLLATPLRRAELVGGYVLGLGFFALVQTLVVVLFTIFVLNVRYRGNVGTIFLVEAVMVLGAVNLGLLLSAFARNEFQAVQFTPMVVLPQVLLSGIFIPIQDLPGPLQPISWFLPLTYTNEAMRAVMVKGAGLTDPLVLRDLGALLLFALVVAFLATRTIRREVA